jgi:hypothetical protein
MLVNLSGSVEVRSAPDANAAPAGHAVNGGTYWFSQVSNDGEWARIEDRDLRAGWVKRRHVNVMLPLFGPRGAGSREARGGG